MKKHIWIPISLLVVTVMLALAPGCRNGEDEGPASTAPALAGKVVDAGGGTVAIANPSAPEFGTQIVVPPDALSTPTPVTIHRVSPSSLGAHVMEFDLGPSGTRFAKPVDITLKYSQEYLAEAGISDPSSLRILALGSGSSPEVLPTVALDPVHQTITAQTTHFSKFAVAKPQALLAAAPSPGPGSAPAPTPAPAAAGPPPIPTWVLQPGYPKADPELASLTTPRGSVTFALNQMSFRFEYEARGNEPAVTGTCTFNFSAPPARLTAGKPYKLVIQGKASPSLFREPVRPGGYYMVSPMVDALRIKTESIKVDQGQKPQIDPDGNSGLYLGCHMEAVTDASEIVFSTSGEAIYTLTVSPDAPDEFMIAQVGTYGYAANCADFLYKKATGPLPPLPVEKYAGAIEMADANPAFTKLTLNMFNANTPGRPKEEAAFAATVAREGTTADGVSLIYLRTPFKHPGSVTYSVEGSDGGALSDIYDNPWLRPGGRSVTVQTVHPDAEEDRNRHWAFAVYRPPPQSPSGAQGTTFKVRMKFTPEHAQVGPEQEAERSFRLVHAPVVLVHGTYDNPVNCWHTPLKSTADPYQLTMHKVLIDAGFQVFELDWEKTSGGKDPSDFARNEKTIWEGPDGNGAGGIRTAVEAYRQMGFACTQVDIVSHSQGGLIARVFAKGLPADEWREDKDIHHEDGRKCSINGKCWYHTFRNFGHGDIHKLITISTTHYGSDIPRLLNAFMEIRDGTMVRLTSPVLSSLLGTAHVQQGVTGSFFDQVPESGRLRFIGRTAIPSHAIACVGEDQDMVDVDNGYYQSRLNKIWMTSHNRLRDAFDRMGQPDDAVVLEKLSAGYSSYFGKEPTLETCSRRLRAATFGNCPNDCTVRQESSMGGLPPQYCTIIPRTMHGYATRYKAVQDRVIQLLLDDGQLFCKEGFPRAGQVPARKPAPDKK